MAKRHFLMLARKYEPKRHNIEGWFMSEKLDGMRCFWDGGISTGELKANVPWANTDKDERYKVPQVATGLWSRSGNVIHAPHSWLKNLPKMPLDGELWLPEFRQELMKVVKKQKPVEDSWNSIEYHVFDSPSIYMVFANGKVDFTGSKKEFVGCIDWCKDRGLGTELVLNFEDTYHRLVAQKFKSPVKVVEQNVVRSDKHLNIFLQDITARGGEGVMLRDPESVWVPERINTILKVKKLDDAEGTVTGYTSGRETDKGSKLLGLMGNCILRLENGQTLELSGFTEEERDFKNRDMEVYATQHPGKEVPDWFEHPLFPKGSKVTFQYRGLTKDKVPCEARFWRKYLD